MAAIDIYNDLIFSKKHTKNNYGIPVKWIPDSMFDFQSYITEYSIKKGRCADFIDTGLGKTYIELVIAVNYARHTNKPILIICPLAVAFQFVREANKFYIDDIEYSKNGKYTKKIVIANYERLHYFNPSDFECVICDESSILKNFEGEIKRVVTSFLKKVKYRFLFTATPSPNDFIELGTSSEALGYLGYTDMLTKFFKNNEDTVSPMNIGTEWVLKGHAKNAFFEWVSGWSISMRQPSDLGFSNDLHILPELITNFHKCDGGINVRADGQMSMFTIPARTQSEIRMEQKSTIERRCEMAVELSRPHETSVYWCNLNPEGDLLQKLDKDAYQIKGSMDIDEKEELLTNFFEGNIKKLITKAKMTAFGLNWQHCNHTVYFPDFSYEKYYQAIRRFWRFGQKRSVIVDVPYSEGQERVLQSLVAKGEKANELFSKLNANINKSYEIKDKEFNQPFILPAFLKTA